MSQAGRALITLVVALKECPKCRKCEAMIARLQERYPGRIEFKRVPADSPDAEQFGVVMPPMLLVEDFLLSAGSVPRESGLIALVAEQIGEEPSS